MLIMNWTAMALIATTSMVRAAISDFIVSSEADLRRLEPNPSSVDNEMYFGDDYDGDMCGNDLMYAGLFESDNDIPFGECGSDVSDDRSIKSYEQSVDSEQLLGNVVENGGMNMKLLRAAIKRFASDPRYADMFEDGGDQYDVDALSSCQDI